MNVPLSGTFRFFSYYLFKLNVQGTYSYHILKYRLFDYLFNFSRNFYRAEICFRFMIHLCKFTILKANAVNTLILLFLIVGIVWELKLYYINISTPTSILAWRKNTITSFRVGSSTMFRSYCFIFYASHPPPPSISLHATSIMFEVVKPKHYRSYGLAPQLRLVNTQTNC